MRVGLETLSCDGRTGIGRIVRALSSAFAFRGHEVHVFAHEPGLPDEGIHVHRVPGFPGSKALSKVLFRVGQRQRVLRANCDVTYSFGVGRQADVVAAQSCHKAGIEILQSHPVARSERRNLGLYDAVSLRDEQALLTSGSTKRIVACSNLVRNQIIQFYDVDPERIVVIPNGVASRMTTRDAGVIKNTRRQLGISDCDKVLLFVGNEFGRKGLGTVLEAMARLAAPEVRLLVAGSGNIRAYERFAAALRVAGKVTFLGGVENPEKLFDAVDLFVFPTLYEPFGMVILEAMAAGVPVITSGNCGAVEGMEHGRHGVFLDDPTSAGGLAEWIRTLLFDEELRQKLSAAGRTKAGEFCWDSVADKTLEVLRCMRRSDGTYG
jgi:UDP-glucose:(heptosyl)LPS alpha-1,3-glucosyltransferase